MFTQALEIYEAGGRRPGGISAFPGKIGISWGTAAARQADFLRRAIWADGIENVIRVLEDMEDQKFTNLKFVELDACSGGWGGVLTVENPYVPKLN